MYEYAVNDYDLIVLDLNLPIIDVLRTIRQNDLTTKIIILSARSSVDNRILGLDEGANDYLIKPFDFGELSARIRNLLRRDFSQAPTTLRNGKLSLDPSTKQVHFNEIPMTLTRKEYGILEYLLLHQNQVISAETLTEHVWNNEFDPFSNTLRYHIHSLKKKLAMHSDAEWIKAIRGQGYIMEEQQ